MKAQQTAVPAHILVVDDERTTRQALSEALNQIGHRASYAASGDEALSILASQTFEVVILDLQMPGIDGVSVLKTAEKIAPHTAFIVLTAHATTETAISALRFGAVDYLRKPSSLQAIFQAVERALIKQQAQMRQREAVRLLEQVVENFGGHLPHRLPTNKPVLETADIALNERQQTATYQGEPLELTPVEYKLLRCFVKQPDTVLSYSQLAEGTHGTELEEEEARALLRTHLYRLSHKLGGKEKSPLQSVRGRGFILYSPLR